MNEKELKNYIYSKKNGKTEITFFKFEIIQYGILTKIVKLQSFWDILFSLYDFTSIIISREKIDLIIGVNHTGYDALKLEQIIAKLKTIAVKNLPNEYELSLSNIDISTSWDLTGENIHENSRIEFRKYYAFSSLDVKSNLLQTYISILEKDGMRLIISSEKRNSKNVFSFSICITQNSIEAVMALEKRLIKFLILNPIFGGKLTVLNKNRYKRNLDMILLGFSDIRISKSIVYPLLDPLDSLIIKNSNNLKGVSCYPWLGFLEENNNPLIKPEKKKNGYSKHQMNKLLIFFKNNKFEEISFDENCGIYKMKYRKLNIYFSSINCDQNNNLISYNLQLSNNTLNFDTNTILYLNNENLIFPLQLKSHSPDI